MASNEDIINEEIEALQAIMMDEINVQYNESGQPIAVEIVIKPATAQNIEEQHVRVILVVQVPQLYPDHPPTILLRNPRGIDDDVIELIKNESIKKCEEFIGFPVIYELTELVREKLTANNTPSCSCAICLFNFTQHDHFTKTPCFHYFHSNCLGRYVLNCEQTAAVEEEQNQQPIWMTREKRHLLCPICREPLSDEQVDSECLIKCPPPEESNLLKDFCPTSPEIIALQEKMSSLFIHQKSNGGIIDLEEEKNKFLVAASSLNSLENSDAYLYGTPQSSGSKASNIKGSDNKKGSSSNNRPNLNSGGNKKGGRHNGGGSNRYQGKKDHHSAPWWANRSREHKRNAHHKNQQHSTTNNKLLPQHNEKSNSGSQKNYDKSTNLVTKGTNIKSQDYGNTKNMSKSENKQNRSHVEGTEGGKSDSFNRGRVRTNGPPSGYAKLDKTVAAQTSS